MVRLVEEDGRCPICEKKIWQNSNGLWICARGEVWDTGKYMRKSLPPQIAVLPILQEAMREDDAT